MEKLTPEYILLFNAITDVEEELKQMTQKLMDVQQRAEELFISRSDSEEKTA